MYKLNPNAYGSVFVVPSAVVDNFIFLASELQLKVLLLIAKNASQEYSASALASLLKKNEEDVRDALDFWVNEGVLMTENSAPKEISSVEPVSGGKSGEKEEHPKTEVEKIPIVKPTMEQVLLRQKESPELEYLFNAAQELLGRTVGWDGQARLLMVYDYYGLPADVILMMLEYLRKIGRTSSSEITKLAKNWADNGIDTHEEAVKYIGRMESASGVFNILKARFGISHERPSTKQAQFISEWLEMGFSEQMILRAYDEMVNNTQKPSFPYVNKILLSWHEKGYKTEADVDRAQSEHQAEKEEKKTDSKKNVSYDIEKAKQKAKSGRLKYEKKVTE